MLADQRLQRQVGEDVTIINDEGLIPEEIPHVSDAAGSLKARGGFMAKRDWQPLIMTSWESLGISLGQMVGVHHKLTNAYGFKVIKGTRDQGVMKEWDERLGELFRERTQPLTQTCTENEGFLHAVL
jgi:hypothetical protein